MTASNAQVEQAVAALRAGELVAFPTETVYGLGADAANAEAVRRLYAVKGRPAGHPVIVHVAHEAQLGELGRDVPDDGWLLAKSFWPGPLTIVVRRNPETVVAEVTGGLETVGLRMPDHPLALQLLESFGRGVAAPSANRFGRVSPTTAAHVRADLGDDVRVLLDGGPCRVGVESTIVDVTGRVPAILRVGGVSRAEVERVIGRECAARTAGEIAAPGTLDSHYAPQVDLESLAIGSAADRARDLVAEGRRVGLLAPEPHPRDLPDGLVVLGAPGDAEEYARVLYARFREADELGLDLLLVVGPDEPDGLGAAVADRIRRAARTSRP